MRENTDQRKPVFSHILHSVKQNIITDDFAGRFYWDRDVSYYFR